MFKKLFGSSSSAVTDESANKDIKLELSPPKENEKYRLPYFFPGSIIFLKTDKIEGTVTVPRINGSGYHCLGVFISIVGQNRVKSDGSITTFYKRTKQIKPEGDIKDEDEKVQFCINPLDFPVPSFYGTFADSRYIVQVRIKTQKTEYVQSAPIYVLFTSPYPTEVSPFKAEVGIQNVLHVQFVIQNPMFDCGSVIIGKVHFLVVKIRIINLFIQIKRIEAFNNGIISFKNEAMISQFELLDGMPVRGDWIPIRFHMPNIKAWPYPRKAKENLDVEYSIRLLMVDENGKHYYKDLADSVTRFII